MGPSGRSIRNCLKQRFEHEKIEIGKKYFFTSYLTTNDIKESEGYVVNDCYLDIFDFGEFNLRILWDVSRDQHDFKRMTKKLYEMNVDGIFPILSSKEFVRIIFESIDNINKKIGDAKIIDFRASKIREQIYHKYTGDDANYLPNKINSLLKNGYDIYRLGISVKTSEKQHYFEIVKNGLLIYTSFDNAKNLNEQVDILFSLWERLLYMYYSTLPYIKDLSNLSYYWEIGIQPKYNTLAVYLEEPLTKDKATALFETIRNDFGVIRSEITVGSLHINWHIYDKMVFENTVIVTTPNPKYPDKLVIIPTNENAKESTLKIYEILNTHVPIKKLELAI